MKKFLLIVTIIISGLCLNTKAISLPEVTDHEKVTIYIFRGHGCSHCYEALQYFYDNASKYSDYFNVVTYEVQNNDENSQLMNEVAAKKGDKADGVPYIVVGSNYSLVGFKSSLAEKIVSAALGEYENEEYTDMVANIAKTSKINSTSKNLEESALEEGINNTNMSSSKEESTGSKYDTVIIVGILAVLIGGTVLLIVANKR